MKKIIAVGNGFIANHLRYEIAKEKLLPDNKYIEQWLNVHKPDIVINCMGYCGGPGKNIDQCEIDKERTLLSNTIIPTMLALECMKRNIQFINISSGCVFYGQSPNAKYFHTYEKVLEKVKI